MRAQFHHPEQLRDSSQGDIALGRRADITIL
jgi:hypothetical protein